MLIAIVSSIALALAYWLGLGLFVTISRFLVPLPWYATTTGVTFIFGLKVIALAIIVFSIAHFAYTYYRVTEERKKLVQ